MAAQDSPSIALIRAIFACFLLNHLIALTSRKSHSLYRIPPERPRQNPVFLGEMDLGLPIAMGLGLRGIPIAMNPASLSYAIAALSYAVAAMRPNGHSAVIDKEHLPLVEKGPFIWTGGRSGARRQSEEREDWERDRGREE
ncbi:hypothetical protein C8J56DRAFT_1160372 [Mycena floridula]|nr:hypothetical protein C8J56DRAFT_1160372 [Mycena floridula]